MSAYATVAFIYIVTNKHAVLCYKVRGLKELLTSRSECFGLFQAPCREAQWFGELRDVSGGGQVADFPLPKGTMPGGFTYAIAALCK